MCECLRADRPQRRRHRHGSNLCVLESGLFDGSRPLKDGVAPSRVLGRRVCDETRVVLRVQNALVTGVVRVVRIHVDGRQTRRVLEVPDQETRADIGSQVERLQARHAIEGTDDRLHRARQRQRLDRGVGERFVVDCCELGGVGRVILEGNFLQVGAFEGFVVDGAHTGGHPHLGQLGRESTGRDARDSLGDFNVLTLSLVLDEDTVIVRDEVAARIGLDRHGHSHSLSHPCLARDGRAQCAGSRLLSTLKVDRRCIVAAIELPKSGGVHAPGDCASLEGGGEERVQVDLMVEDG